MLNERMIIGKCEEGGGHGHNLRHCLGSGMEGLRKTMKTLSQDRWLPDLDLNKPGPPEYEVGAIVWKEFSLSFCLHLFFFMSSHCEQISVHKSSLYFYYCAV
jgi:hypothetical protein